MKLFCAVIDHHGVLLLEAVY